MVHSTRADDLRGVLVVDKPAGITSARVVSRVKRALRVRRAGHTGTLDPLATGVLPICLGGATKLAGYLTADDKAYEATLELGVETDTLDADGDVVSRRSNEAAQVGRAALVEAMAALVGEQDQRPPVYSALRRGGERLYEAAREGRSVEPEPRRVRVDAFDLLEFYPPRARVFIACAKGTYVRALARDLGEALGCGAHIAALRRVRSGAFEESAAVPLAELAPARARDALISPAQALSGLPAAEVPAGRIRQVASGLVLPWGALSGAAPPAGWVRLLTPGGALLAIARVEGGEIAYERVFPEVLEYAPAP